MPRNPAIHTVLLIGSGPIIIGQACEFDYSGTQAARSLREEGVRVILINSNPATIMTDPATADVVYLLPLTKASITKILHEHQIDAVLPTVGGQTALNLALDCHDAGLWAQHHVQVIGVDFDAIRVTEDSDADREAPALRRAWNSSSFSTRRMPSASDEASLWRMTRPFSPSSTAREAPPPARRTVGSP